MPIKPVAYTEASPEQRSEYARTFLNLPVDGSDTPDSIDAKILAAQPGVTMIFVNEADSPDDLAASETGKVELAPEEGTGKHAGSLGRGDPRAVIMIPIVETEDGSGARDVLVGVNGRAWQLKRGVDLPVPWRVVCALRDAKSTIVRHSQEEGKEGEVLSWEAQRFNFNFVEQPSQAAIDEWQVRTSAEFCA